MFTQIQSNVFFFPAYKKAYHGIQHFQDNKGPNKRKHPSGSDAYGLNENLSRISEKQAGGPAGARKEPCGDRTSRSSNAPWMPMTSRASS